MSTLNPPPVCEPRPYASLTDEELLELYRVNLASRDMYDADRMTVPDIEAIDLVLFKLGKELTMRGLDLPERENKP